MYSASCSPLAICLATYCIMVSYGRMGYAVMTSTSANLLATATASLPLIRASCSEAATLTAVVVSASTSLHPPLRRPPRPRRAPPAPRTVPCTGTRGTARAGRRSSGPPTSGTRPCLSSTSPLALVVGEGHLVDHGDAPVDG